jgi:hypothetical protein
MLSQGEEMMRNFANYIVGSLQIDDMQDASGSLHAAVGGQ